MDWQGRPWSCDSDDGGASAAPRDVAALDDDFAKGLCPDCYGKVAPYSRCTRAAVPTPLCAQPCIVGNASICIVHAAFWDACCFLPQAVCTVQAWPLSAAWLRFAIFWKCMLRCEEEHGGPAFTAKFNSLRVSQSAEVRSHVSWCVLQSDTCPGCQKFLQEMLPYCHPPAATGASAFAA